jgi:plasmid replication initiation protein
MSDEPQLEMFRAAYTDIPIRDQRDLMERPFFSLSKSPRKTPIQYNVNGTMVKVSPVEEYGIATIWDTDILIWAATQITEMMDRGGTPSRKMQFHPYSLLKGIRRGVGGDQYQKLQAALRRLAATYIQTTIRVPKGSRKKTVEFHWIDQWDALEENGKPIGMSITLPDWLFEGIVQGGGVLTIHEDYFTLKGGIERWLYRVARKHAGSQEGGWRFTMRQLHEKSGSASKLANFACDIRKAVSADVLPEYTLEIVRNRAGQEVVCMSRRVLNTG